jgi:hypothetical protein
LDSFSKLFAFTLLIEAQLHSFSSLVAFKDLCSGQWKILTPEGESGRIQKNLAFQRQVINEAPGLKQIFSIMK